MSGVEVEGMDIFTELLKDMTLTQTEESRAMKNALEIPYQETLNNAPYLTGFTKKSIKKIVKKEGLGTVGRVRVDSWTAIFTEFGTSKDKSNVNWFGSSIDKTNNTFLETLAKELFKKAK